MPPRSPLPRRHGLEAAWVRTPDRVAAGAWPMGPWLRDRLGERVDVARLLAEGRFVHEDGRAVRGDDPCPPYSFVWFHRDLRAEPEVPGELVVVHRDERLVVVDKPAFLATIPRGRHVVQSVVVRLRAELDLPDLSTLHRLDRVTSGLVALATEPRWRGPYQQLWERGLVTKTYLAMAAHRPDLELPVVVREPVDGRPAETLVERHVADGGADDGADDGARDGHLTVYRLTPTTGRRHQLRRHLASLGLPIVGDPLHPVVREVDVDDFTTPLQLLAAELAFVDPVDGIARRFVSGRTLPLPAEPASEVSASRG